MPRFGRHTEVFARAQKSVNLDENLDEFLRGSGEGFDNAANRLLALGIECEEGHSEEIIKIPPAYRLKSRLNLDEYLIFSLRERQQHHESYSDTVIRYLWIGIACAANHARKEYKSASV